eukprot:gene21598-biopygen23642
MNLNSLSGNPVRGGKGPSRAPPSPPLVARSWDLWTPAASPARVSGGPPEERGGREAAGPARLETATGLRRRNRAPGDSAAEGSS